MRLNHRLVLVIILFLVSLLYFVPSVTAVTEGFMGYAPLDYTSIGPYSGFYLKNTEAEYWKHPPAINPLLTGKIYTPQGTPMDLSPTAMNPDPDTSGTSLDGTKNTENSMFMFARNQCKPECCPATFSCDGGCVCTTPQQRAFINQRGNNRTTEDGF
jgi:hypothetical protein